MSFKCPSCKKTIFNRRIPTCEFCGVTLPEQLIFSEQEKRALDTEYRDQQAELSRERNRRIQAQLKATGGVESTPIIESPTGVPLDINLLPSTLRCMKCGLSYDANLATCHHCEGKSNAEIIEQLHIPHSEQLDSSETLGKYFYLTAVLIGLLVFIFLG